jgi:beta-mannosidase
MQQRILSEGWQLKLRDETLALHEAFRSEEGWLLASVPGVVHQDLIAAGHIPDPFIGHNEEKAQWVGERDWLYRCRFELPEGISAMSTVDLCFDGLDTFATVWVNGEQTLVSDNMFLPQRLPVTSLVKPGANEVWILFESALRRSREREAVLGPLEAWNTDPSRVYARKAQYHYGWDWGPCLITAGPWRAVRIEAYDARIADVHCPMTLTDDLQQADISVSVDIDQHADAALLCLQMELYDPQGKRIALTYSSVYDSTIKHTFTIDHPTLWWPNGYGTQPLYRLVTSLIELRQDGMIVDQREMRLGIRMIKLIQEPLDDEPGRTFYFEVNNTPIFCGGANWIPADSFTPRIDADRYRALLTRAADAHMSMIRVWGGGIYEDDCFYDLCDELGLLVWQDFMFACGRYPADKAFQAGVRAEAEAQVRRLRHHPCIALWCGNNEDYQLAYSLGYYDNSKAPDAASSFPARVIYEQLLPNVCATLDGAAFYRPGSPFDGIDANDPTVGDRHTWDVWHGKMAPYQDYPRFAGRFISEFGMGAFPAEATIATFAAPADRFPESAVIQRHHKAGEGQMRIETYIAGNIHIPTDLTDYIYASQFIQSEALATAYSGWRRRWGAPGRRAIGGALVWQLDDCWPAVSWALIDYELRAKPAYYTVRRALAPLAVSLARDGNSVAAWVVHSMQQSIEAELELWVTSLAGQTTTSNHQRLVLPPNQVVELEAWNVGLDCDQIVGARLHLEDQVVARATAWPEPFKNLALPDPQLRITHLGDERLRISATRPAKGVWLTAPHDVDWSDNMLDILPDDDQIIVARGLGAAEVTVRHL